MSWDKRRRTATDWPPILAMTSLYAATRGRVTTYALWLNERKGAMKR